MKTILTGLGTLGACAAARRYLNRSDRKPAEYVGGRVRLTALWNEGAAFGLKIPPDLLPVISAGALGLFWCLRYRSPVGAGLVLGGGLSNLLERLRSRRVYDYIQFPRAPGRLKRYVYNLADFSVFLGGLSVLLGGEQ